MAVKISGKYQGNLRVSSNHGPSDSILETDAPTDNNGKGEKFSPTDLVVTAYASCMLTIMGIVAERDGLDLKDTSYTAEKYMSTESPRKIAKIIIDFAMPASISEDQRKKLEKAAHACPVHHSLAPEIEKLISFNYPD